MKIDDQTITKLMGVAANFDMKPPIIINPNTKTFISKPVFTTKVRFTKEMEDTSSSEVTFDFKFDGDKFEPLTKPINFRSPKYLKYLNKAMEICDDLLRKLNSNV